MQYRTYTKEQVEEVKRLFEDGKSKCEISRIMGIPRATLRDWLQPRYIKKTTKTHRIYEAQKRIENLEDYLNSPEIRAAYSYILAIYLADGCISTFKTNRSPKIRLFNDTKYIKNTEEWKTKLQILLPTNTVSCAKKKQSNCYIITCYSSRLLDLFPQYAGGEKHKRKIELTDWQRTIVQQYPHEFIRGCFQSDGCIYNQKIGKYTYRKYAFTNYSEDIIDFFLFALQQVGINKQKYKYPNSNKFQIQNFSKADLLILEKIIPYKE